MKHLARPLVTNLPETFNQLAPLLGKSRQKHYVRRFASEAFAFLLRRVKEPTQIVKTMLGDIDENEDYSEAITNTFVESMKAPGQSLHSKALSLFRALVRNVQTSGASTMLRCLVIGRVCEEVALKGILDQVLYNTSKENFSPMLDDIVKLLLSNTSNLAIDLLLLCCTAKGGSKIKDWAALVNPITDVLETSGVDSKQKCHLVATLVARVDPVTSKSTTKKIFEHLKKKGEIQIGVFCLFFGKFNESYFQKWGLEEFVR